MSNDLDDLAVRLAEVAQSLSDPALREVMTDLGVAAKEDVETAARRDLGPDRKFSGWPKRAALNSGFEHTGPGEIVLTPRPLAVATVAEHGRRTGAVPRRRRSRVTVRTPWGFRTFTSDEPMWNGSTRGKRTWSDAVDEIERRTPDRAIDAIYKQMRTTLGA